MAVLGQTKLEGVNEVMHAVGNGRLAALPGTADGSDGAEAQYYLEQATRDVLSRGWPCNTRLCEELTANGDGNIVLDGKTLRVRGAGKYQFHQFTTRAGKLYDIARGTDSFGSGTKITIDIIEEIANTSPDDFEAIDPQVKAIIIAEASQRYSRRKLRDQTRDQFLKEEKAAVEVAADHNKQPAPNPNTQPFFPPMAQPRQE